MSKQQWTIFNNDQEWYLHPCKAEHCNNGWHTCCHPPRRDTSSSGSPVGVVDKKYKIIVEVSDGFKGDKFRKHSRDILLREKQGKPILEVNMLKREVKKDF